MKKTSSIFRFSRIKYDLNIKFMIQLQVIVDFNKLDLIMHPIFEKLIEVKWAKFGLKGALFQLSINLLFVASWTVQALAEPSGEPWKYSLPDDVWRIALYVSICVEFK